MTVDLEFKSSWSSETYLPHTINPFSHATLSSYLRNGYVPPSSRAIEVLNGLQRDISWALDDCDEEIYEKEEQIRPLELRLAEVKKIRSQLVAIGRRALSVTAQSDS
ncbi:hypothetical protein BT96DRAFT_989261 [Gymnopus androsaceus JB14]|uniref:Uncharacterized protein n=1 Tax=Gymnopus androsaceus JB14 TaxID=1447944 RepID=A0A6A4I3B4_9AGAR|nr:hypothetical protein BT96DRAFT_989261 [Gymnopus androsaceus JB14]